MGAAGPYKLAPSPRRGVSGSRGAPAAPLPASSARRAGPDTDGRQRGTRAAAGERTEETSVVVSRCSSWCCASRNGCVEKCQHFLARKDEGILKRDPCQQKLGDQHRNLRLPRDRNTAAEWYLRSDGAQRPQDRSRELQDGRRRAVPGAGAGRAEAPRDLQERAAAVLAAASCSQAPSNSRCARQLVGRFEARSEERWINTESQLWCSCPSKICSCRAHPGSPRSTAEMEPEREPRGELPFPGCSPSLKVTPRLFGDVFISSFPLLQSLLDLKLFPSPSATHHSHFKDGNDSFPVISPLETPWGSVPGNEGNL